MIELTGTPSQKAQFLKRIRQDPKRIAADVLAMMGYHDAPILFRIVLRGSVVDVLEQYREFYNLPLNSVAFCSKSRKTIYISASDVTARVVAHEMAHHVLNTLISDPIPTVLHELIAQTVEERTCKNYSSWLWW